MQNFSTETKRGHVLGPRGLGTSPTSGLETRTAGSLRALTGVVPRRQASALVHTPTLTLNEEQMEGATSEKNDRIEFGSEHTFTCRKTRRHEPDKAFITTVPSPHGRKVMSVFLTFTAGLAKGDSVRRVWNQNSFPPPRVEPAGGRRGQTRGLDKTTKGRRTDNDATHTKTGHTGL